MRVVVALILMTTLISSVSFSAPPTQSKDFAQKPNMTATALYLNSFDTIGQLMDELIRLRAITVVEKKSVNTFLAKNKVDIDAKLVKARGQAGKIQFGNISIGMDTSGRLKLNNGKIFHFSQNSQFDKVFIDVFSSFSKGSSSTSLFSLMIDNAKASEASDLFEDVSGAAYFATYHLFKTFYTGMIGLCDVVTNALGFPADYVLSGLRTILYKGTVTCDDAGQYVLSSGIDSFEWKQDFQKWKSFVKQDAKDNEGKFEGVLDTYSSTLAGACTAGCELVGHALCPDQKPGTPMKDDLVTKFAPDGSIYGCNKKNAAILEEKLKKEAKKISSTLENFAVDKSKQSSADSAGTQ